MKLSVIIPVYNVEKYIERCLKSVLNQSIEEYEILIINDGSTDSSLKICEKFSELNRKIKIISQKNQGLSVARNTGIEAASGEYLIFIDSDDFIIENSLEVLLKTAKSHNSEIVVGNGITYISSKEQYPKTKRKKEFSGNISGIDFLTENLEQNAMSMCVPLNLYSRRMIVDNGLYFKPNLLHEDQLWTIQVFLLAKKVYYIDLDFYMHFRREGSITQSQDNRKNAIDLVYICNELSLIVNGLKESRAKKILNDYLVTLYLNAFYVGKLYDKNIIDNNFFDGKVSTKRNKIKVFIFKKNMYAYYFINYSGKIILKSLLNRV